MANKLSFNYIAVAYNETGEAMPFEKANYFKIFFVKNGKVKKTRIISLFPKDYEESVEELKHAFVNQVVAKSFLPKTLRYMKELKLQAFSSDCGPGLAVKQLLDGELKETMI